MDKREQIQKLQDLGLSYLEAKEQVMTNDAIKAAEEAASHAEKLKNEAQERLGSEYAKAAEAAANEADKLKAEAQALTGSAKEKLGDDASEAKDEAEELKEKIAEEEVKAHEIWDLFLDGLREFFRNLNRHDFQIFVQDELKLQMKVSVALIILILLMIFLRAPFVLLVVVVAMILGQVFGATFQFQGPGKTEGLNHFFQKQADFLRSLFGRKMD